VARKSTPEGLIQASILRWLKHHDIFHWRSNNTGVWDPTRKLFRKSPNTMKGVSDILGVFQGRLLAIEVKSAKGRISPEQEQFLSQINQEGGVAFVARSIQDVEDYLFPKPTQDVSDEKECNKE